MSRPSLFQRVSRYIDSACGWRAACLWAIVLVVMLRFGLGLVMGVAWSAVKHNLPTNTLTDTTVYGGLPAYPAFPADVLLGVWQRWDAVHYLKLAWVGYFGISEGDSVFYPLYAWLTRAVTQLFRSDYLVGGLIVSTAATVVTLACLYRLADKQYGYQSARWTVVALAIYPTAFFLTAPFTESLFLALTLGAFLAAYKHWWLLVGMLGALASLTRGPGMLTSAALGWIAWCQWRKHWPWGCTRHVVVVAVGLLLPVLGGLAFQLWRARAGFAPMNVILRNFSGLEIVNPASGLWYALAQLVTAPSLENVLDVSSALLFLGLTGAMVANRRWRRGDWLIYMVINLAVFLSKHSLVASSLQSLARYILVLFPGFIVIGDWLSRRGPRLRFVYAVSSSALLVILSSLYTLWWFIG